MRKLLPVLTLLILAFAQTAYAASCSSGNTAVLQAIPAIAQVFAPVAGVNWQNFAQDLAGICAVESTCNPNTKHVLQNGAWSQYQGLYQMNMNEVARAENYLNQVYPQLQQLAQSGQIPQNAWTFFQQAVQSGRSSSGDRRFLPEYGVILGAAKHIQIQKQLQAQYPGDPLRQAAGDMVAQFSGIAESQIAAGNFNASITGSAGNANTEAGALAVNKVAGTTLAGTIESAGATYGTCMKTMMTQMSQVTSGLTSVPTVISPFTAPPYMPGTSPQLSIPYSGISTLMEMGAITPVTGLTIAPTVNNLPPLNPSAPIYTQPASYTSPQSTASAPSSASTSGACTPQYSCSSNTVYYESDSCTRSVFEQCQYGCTGTICAPAPSASSSSQSLLSTVVSGGSGAPGNSLFAAASGSGSLSLNAGIYTIVQGDISYAASGAQMQVASSTGGMTYPNETFDTGNFSQTYALGPSSSFSLFLSELKIVLTGLLGYLHSL